MRVSAVIHRAPVPENDHYKTYNETKETTEECSSFQKCLRTSCFTKVKFTGINNLKYLHSTPIWVE